MVVALFSVRRMPLVTVAVARTLLAAALACSVLVSVDRSWAQAPPTIPSPGFEGPESSDPLAQPGETAPPFDFTQPLDDPLGDDAGLDIDFGDSGLDPAESSRPSGPPRRPVTSLLDEPEDLEEEVLPWGMGRMFHDGPVLAPNECSKCLIGTCTGHHRWYSSIDFLMMRRSRPNGVGFTVDFNQQFQRFFNTLSTDNLVFAFEPGVRATFGRCLGTDCKNRDHSVEFTYLGVNEWEEDFISDRGSGLLRASAFLAAGSSPTVFDNADSHELQYVSDFNSFQMDYKIRGRLDKDRMVFRPEGTWHREAWPGLLPSFYFGVRHVSINEDFAFRASRAGEINTSGLYTTSTRNNLIGLHAGAELVYQTWKGSVGLRGGAGALASFLDLFSGLTSVSDDNVDDNFVVRMQDKDQDLAVVGDLSVIGNYHVTKQFTLHVAYNMIWVGGIALAPSQMTFNIDEPARFQRNGFTYYQGFSIGGEFVW